MSVELNHTIVCATDRERSAEFLAGILGLFVPVRPANGVMLDSLRVDWVTSRHQAFLVGDSTSEPARSTT